MWLTKIRGIKKHLFYASFELLSMKVTDKTMLSHNKAQVLYFSSRTKSTMIPDVTPYILKHINMLIKFANIKPGDRVLEIGCGMGRYTLNLAACGIKVHGLDMTRFLLDKLEEYNKGRYHIPLYCKDVINHPPELNNRFDAVIGFFTLHHLHDISASFNAMAEMVKPGGCIVFLEPNAFNPLFYIQILITPGMTWKGDGGLFRMRKAVIFEAMKESGLVDIQLIRFGFFPPFLSNLKWLHRLESVLEKAPLWRSALPFQLFKGIKRK